MRGSQRAHNNVADRIRIVFLFDADPDPAFHFDANQDPEPAFHFDADPDPDPTFTLMQIRIQESAISGL